ncbi:SDR family NAD(P)-dependent oxidoreductase [Limibacter armeniacum]|uniref:SDR family NAD(P)-dependent oxidoreductase n=1 Tax=Limibacter armeniacum TaxID=466084 RepID=UPI002FE5F2A9
MEYMEATKTVIITGGNSGLGFECAKTIAKANQGWHIVLACRNAEKGIQATKVTTEETGNKNVSFLKLDLASLASVRNFVAEFQSKHLPPLQGLVCNAGITSGESIEYTKDGFELTFGVNHLGHFLLTNLLLPHFAEPARVVVVSSNTHNPDIREGKLVGQAMYLGAERLAHPDSEYKLKSGPKYTTSKLCNLLFAYELDRILQKENKKITVNSFDPGACPGTNLAGENNIRKTIMDSWFGKSLLKIMGVVASTPEKSGEAMARLLLDSRLENVSGKYFQIYEDIASSKDSYNKTFAKELWEDSIKLTNYQNS